MEVTTSVLLGTTVVFIFLSILLAIIIRKLNKKIQMNEYQCKKNTDEITARLSESDAYNYRVRNEWVNAFATNIMTMNTTQGILVIEAGKMSYCNQAAVDLLGCNQDAVGYRYNNAEEFQEIERISETFNKNEYGMLVSETDADDRYVDIYLYKEGIVKVVFISDATERVKEEQEQIYLENHDKETRLYNRKGFENTVNERLEMLQNVEQTEYNGILATFTMEDYHSIEGAEEAFVIDTYFHRVGKVLSDLEDEVHFTGGRVRKDMIQCVIWGKTKGECIRYLGEIFEKLGKIEIVYEGKKLGFIYTGAFCEIEYKSYEELQEQVLFTYYMGRKHASGKIYEFDKICYEKQGYLRNGKSILEKYLANKKVTYSLESVVDIKTAKIMAYEVIPEINHNLGIQNYQQLLNIAHEYGKLHELEYKMFYGKMRYYIRLLNNGSIPYGTKVIIRSIQGTALTPIEYETFYEKFYEYMKHLVVIIDDEQGSEFQMLKKTVIQQWGCIEVNNIFPRIMGDDALGNILYIPERYVHSKETSKVELVKRMIAEAHGNKSSVLIEGVDTKELAQQAIEMEADYIRGAYTNPTSKQTLDIAERVIVEIGQMNRNKRMKGKR